MEEASLFIAVGVASAFMVANFAQMSFNRHVTKMLMSISDELSLIEESLKDQPARDAGEGE